MSNISIRLAGLILNETTQGMVKTTFALTLVLPTCKWLPCFSSPSHFLALLPFTKTSNSTRLSLAIAGFDFAVLTLGILLDLFTTPLGTE